MALGQKSRNMVSRFAEESLLRLHDGFSCKRSFVVLLRLHDGFFGTCLCSATGVFTYAPAEKGFDLKGRSHDDGNSTSR